MKTLALTEGPASAAGTRKARGKFKALGGAQGSSMFSSSASQLGQC